MNVRPLGTLRLAAAALLLALVAITLPLKASQPRHVHEASTAGVYNEDHVLASLEFLGGEGPLPVLPTAVSLLLVTAAGARLRRSRPAAPALRLAGSRAPPA
jgi:predicted acyltransferase